MTVEYAVYGRDGDETARGIIGGEPVAVPAGTYRVEVVTRIPLSVQDVTVRGDQTTLLEMTAKGTVQMSAP